MRGLAAATLPDDSFFPNFYVPAVMENSYDVNGLVTHFEIDGIWKPLEQCPTDAIFNFGKLVWPLDHSLHDWPNIAEPLLQKYTASSAINSSVPAKSFACIRRTNSRLYSLGVTLTHPPAPDTPICRENRGAVSTHASSA
jgi:hypothetical protein